MPQYFEEADEKTIRQYAEIIAMTDDAYRIASYLEIPEQIIRKVKEHIFIKEHELDIPNYETNTTSHVRGNFTPDGEIAKLWIGANNGELQQTELSKFQRLIAHEYIEQALMADGLPYHSPEGWSENSTSGFVYSPTPEHFGAHDLAPNTTANPNPFSHWVKMIGKSAEGLMLADDLSNLDELLEAIREKI